PWPGLFTGAGNLPGCDEPRSGQAARARGLLIVAGEDVVDGDVHGNGLQAGTLPQGGDDMPLDVACHVVDGISVGDRYGEVDDGGAAEDADCGMRMTVLEAALLGEFSELAVRAAAEGDADAGDHTGAVAGQGGHDPGGDSDDPEVSGLQRVPHVADQDPDLAHDRRGQAAGSRDRAGR